MLTPYAGAASLTEEILPEPSEAELARQRLETECRELRDKVRHLEGALKIAAKVLQPYYLRLNGRP